MGRNRKVGEELRKVGEELPILAYRGGSRDKYDMPAKTIPVP